MNEHDNTQNGRRNEHRRPPPAPPRIEVSDDELRPRSWSGGLEDITKTVLQTMTPPLFRRKTASTLEETTLEFHNQNQAFLHSVGKDTPSPPPRTPSSRRASRKSFSKTTLPSINDDAEENEKEESIETSAEEPLVDTAKDSVTGLHSNGSTDYGSTASIQLESMSKSRLDTDVTNKKEEALETKLRQMLERDSTKPSEKKQFINEYMQELHKEHDSLIAQWRTEFEQANMPSQSQKPSPLQDLLQPCIESMMSFLSYAEVFISNLPLSIGAVALAWVTMGVVWFKFFEETLDSCIPVPYHSPLCSFGEFPGCFECDTSSKIYQMALLFHNTCSIIAGLLAMTFLLKLVIAWKVVEDELSNPTTATPCGVVCITLVCVFAGHGWIGEGVVLTTACFQFGFAFWFLYMAIWEFRILPDPSWFPSTVGLSYAAIKTWLYFPLAGKIFLSFCMTFFFTTFFISVIRVALSPKISAPVCWIQLSAPSITMYAMTIIAQPSRQALESFTKQDYHDLMHEYYMPAQHVMMALSLIGMLSAVHSLWMRWDTFSKIQFSPAHAAFCFPTLSHTNAVQAYRGAVNAYSNIANGSPYKIILFSYWIAWLIAGTCLNLVFTYKYLKRLPKWTKIDMWGETEPPQPSETIMSEMLHDAHEVMEQTFVSPAVLQANEAGALVRVRHGTDDFQRYGPYVRTRQVRALGFDPTMDDDALKQERAKLLDWVAKNAPRTRKRTLSVPMIMSLKSKDGSGIYGSMETGTSGGSRHSRAQTFGSSSDMANIPWPI